MTNIVTLFVLGILQKAEPQVRAHKTYTTTSERLASFPPGSLGTRDVYWGSLGTRDVYWDGPGTRHVYWGGLGTRHVYWGGLGTRDVYWGSLGTRDV